jgi:hypothetical protein
VPETGGEDAKIASELKEALSIGIMNAVKLTNLTDGFFGNSLIEILLLPKLKTAETGLRMMGSGPQVDQFVLGMNRAAGKAVPEASKYFKQAILSMTISHARDSEWREYSGCGLL